MKTTNLEISKKLKEIGFETDYDLIWCENYKRQELLKLDRVIDDWELSGKYHKSIAPSYDLDTLLDCIQKKLSWLDTLSIHYARNNESRLEYLHISSPFDRTCCSPRLTGESLADTAGRLIIQLHEKGLINFGGEND